MHDQPQHHDESLTSPITRLYISQQSIGWTNMMRGFLSQEWNSYLTSTISDRPMRCDQTNFFAQLIRTLWTAQTDFWAAYQLRRHNPPGNPELDTQKMQELKTEVRFLLTSQDKVLQEHSTSYFPQEPESFLKHSTMSQLQSYITNYGTAIHASVQQAKKQSIARTPRLFTYQGFQRIPRNPAPSTTHNQLTTLQPATHTPHQEAVPQLPEIEQTQTEINPLTTMETITVPATPARDTQVLCPQPMERPPPAPNEPSNAPRRIIRHIQQTLRATFPRRRNFREITPPASEVDTISDTSSVDTPTTNTTAQDATLTSTPTPTHHTTPPSHPPATEARAHLPYKHSKWRPSNAVRETFSQYFRPRR